MLIEKHEHIEIWLIAGDYYVYGVTEQGDPRICPSLGMAREIAVGW